MTITAMTDLLRGKRIVALTGAGCSTESGIPDYRGPSTVQVRKPVQYQEFVRSGEARARYWARSVVGWGRVSSAQPNAGHAALALLETGGVLSGVITQNVDGLHHAAGSRRVVELHGSLAMVRCLSCGRKTSRTEFQNALVERNPQWAERVRGLQTVSAPDGDADVHPAFYATFAVPDCACGGIMKPDVVFFGENVPRDTVDQAWDLFERGDCLLVIGSSLTVYSGRRFIYRAQQQGVPIGIINLGPTRADELATVKLEQPIGSALPEVAALLCA
jgi:NAD+-dependent protein deacetylase sirtuin 4